MYFSWSSTHIGDLRSALQFNDEAPDIWVSPHLNMSQRHRFVHIAYPAGVDLLKLERLADLLVAIFGFLFE